MERLDHFYVSCPCTHFAQWILPSKNSVETAAEETGSSLKLLLVNSQSKYQCLMLFNLDHVYVSNEN